MLKIELENYRDFANEYKDYQQKINKCNCTIDTQYTTINTLNYQILQDDIEIESYKIKNISLTSENNDLLEKIEKIKND